MVRPQILAVAGLAFILSGCLSPAPPSAVAPFETAGAMSGSASAGGLLVRAHCAGCHAVGATDESPLKGAVPFREMTAFYPASDLQEAFAEGVVTAHPAMPQFEFTPRQVADLIAYLDSVAGPAVAPPAVR